MALCVLQHQLPGDPHLLVENVVHRVVHPVVVPLGHRTGLRVAVRLVQDAQLFLCRDGHGGEIELLQIPHHPKGVLGHAAGDALGRQIEQFIPRAFPHCLEAGKYGGQGLAHAGGRLDEQVSSLVDAAVNRSGQPLLTIPVGVGELQILQGLLPPEPVEILEPGPLHVLVDQSQKPLLKLLKGVVEAEPPHLLGLDVAVGDLHAHGGKLPVAGQEVSVALGLGQVDRVRILQVF